MFFQHGVSWKHRRANPMLAMFGSAPQPKDVALSTYLLHGLS